MEELADLSWGDTSTTKASYTEEGFPAFSASGQDGSLPYFDFERDGVVLSAIGANCGRVYFARGRWSSIKNTIRFWGREGAADTRFLYYATSDPTVWPKRGSAQPFISQGDARAVQIPVPVDVTEQRRIANVLGALDDKIDSNRRLAGLLEETAATLFRARFVDFVGVEEFEESEIGRIPRGWGVTALGDVLTIVGGSTPSTKEPRFWNGTHCWATPKDLSGARSPILLDTERHITDEGVSRISSRLLPARTVLLSSRAPVGYTAISFVPIAVNQGFIAIPPSDGVPSEFVFFWLREHMHVIKAQAGGTTFAEISKRQFRVLPMVVPPPTELDEFQRAAGPAFDLMAGLEAEVRSLTDLRDALLPKLISGQIRVPETADAAEVLGPAAEAIAAGS